MSDFTNSHINVIIIVPLLIFGAWQVGVDIAVDLMAGGFSSWTNAISSSGTDLKEAVSGLQKEAALKCGSRTGGVASIATEVWMFEKSNIS